MHLHAYVWVRPFHRCVVVRPTHFVRRTDATGQSRSSNCEVTLYGCGTAVFTLRWKMARARLCLRTLSRRLGKIEGSTVTVSCRLSVLFLLRRAIDWQLSLLPFRGPLYVYYFCSLAILHCRHLFSREGWTALVQKTTVVALDLFANYKLCGLK